MVDECVHCGEDAHAKMLCPECGRQGCSACMTTENICPECELDESGE